MTYDHHGRCQHNAYRMSCEDFDELFAFAGGRCQICRKAEDQIPRQQLVIDHDPNYAPIAVRGLLCNKCNSLMGEFDRRRSLDQRCYIYRNRAWFLRILIGRREAQFEAVA